MTRPQGYFIEMTLIAASRTVAAIVTGSESQARKEGVDFLCAVCSETCGAALRAALRADIEAGSSP